jgi:hypothetical protein
LSKVEQLLKLYRTESWVFDIKGTVQVLVEYLFHQDVQDQQRWKLTASGEYSSKSAYTSQLHSMSWD